MSYWGYSQPTMADIEDMALASIRRLEKKGEKLSPIPALGRNAAIAKSWWGEAWCDNLERYADYANRIGRGKKYVRAGAVIDLTIEEGCIHGRVQGSSLRKVYDVFIRVRPIDEKRAAEILNQCGHRIQNLESLVDGKFPEDLKHLFTQSGGLFPTPREISLNCSCPDWATMCKHVAAVLYAVGTRLDTDPLLFFRLRGLDADSFVEKVVGNRLDMMLQNADRPSDRILDGDWENIFGL